MEDAMKELENEFMKRFRDEEFECSKYCVKEDYTQLEEYEFIERLWNEGCGFDVFDSE